MRIRNCPYCKTACGPHGKQVPYGHCSFCHGKRKLNAEHVQWVKRRHKYLAKISTDLEDEFEGKLYDAINEKMRVWEKRYPKPRKFPFKEKVSAT